MTTPSEPVLNVCQDLGEFVESILLPLYPRLVIEVADLPALRSSYPGSDVVWCVRAWCREWWRHPDAVVRLDCVWREWELMRRGGENFTFSMWLTQHADHHMAMLLSPYGTFAACSATAGHERGHSLHPHRHHPRLLPSATMPPELRAALGEDRPPRDGRLSGAGRPA